MGIDNYHTGLHLIVDFDDCVRHCDQLELFRETILGQIAQLDLHMLGDVFHAFPNGAFTAVVCLTESHLSVHTWPEFRRVTCDVFLSNYQQVNDQKAQQLMHVMEEFFGGRITQRVEVRR